MKKNFTIRVGRFGFNAQFKRKFKTEFKINFWAINKKAWDELKSWKKYNSRR